MKIRKFTTSGTIFNFGILKEWDYGRKGINISMAIMNKGIYFEYEKKEIPKSGCLTYFEYVLEMYKKVMGIK